MAKTKPQAGLKELPAEGPEIVQLHESPVRPANDILREHGMLPEENEARAVETPCKWQVSLNCPTPLAYQTLTVEAATEQEAWEKFMQANGISGSQHDKKITRLE